MQKRIPSPAKVDRLAWARRLCHRLCASKCVDEKRQGLHEELLRQRPHWSVLRREEQFERIDLGEKIPFDIALPLPAKDRGFSETAEGVELFRERFRCQRCGRCCYTPGAGLYLEGGDFERIAKYLGSARKLKPLCRRSKALDAWVLRQPCPFYDEASRGCRIYPVRPLTCALYPLHPPLKKMPYHLAVDAFCPAARRLAKETLGWWIICENSWAKLLRLLEG
jgi:Fe-S-cluster containining protein